MSATTWHLDPEQIDGYVASALAPAAQASAEAHLEACPSCRSRVASATAPGAFARRLERIWAATADRIDAPRASWLERCAASVAVPDHLARVIGASAGFRTAWLLATALAVAAGLALAHGEVGPVVFLLLSPLVPVAGVAAVFGGASGGAGSHAMEIATPFGELRLVLLRAAAVTATSIALLGAATLAVPATGLEAMAWLLPALALTTTTLALTTRIAPERAAVSVGVGWLLLIAVIAVELPTDARPTGDELGAIAAPLQLIALALLVASSVVFLARRQHLDLPTR